jgi:hypothetical protein
MLACVAEQEDRDHTGWHNRDLQEHRNIRRKNVEPIMMSTVISDNNITVYDNIQLWKKMFRMVMELFLWLLDVCVINSFIVYYL